MVESWATGTLLSLKSASLGYPGAAVLDQVDLDLAAGDFLLLAGANGSGKSTLIRSLLGVLPLIRGERILADGVGLGYVPQQMALDPTFPVSVSDVVRMGLWGLTPRFPRREARKRIAAVLAEVGMETRGHELLGRLSGGQKQRVLLARALVLRPTLLLLDEPVSGVDARATSIILDILHQEAERGTAVVLVSHQPLALRDFANRAVLVKERRTLELPVAEMCSAEGLEKLWT